MNRVKNSAALVLGISSGGNGTLARKSRVWSSAMIIMTSPRRMSTAARRVTVETTGDDLTLSAKPVEAAETVAILFLTTTDVAVYHLVANNSERKLLTLVLP